MNAAFSNLLTSRLQALTADLRYLHKPSGDLIAPVIVETMLPPKESGYEEGQDIPLVRWLITGGEFAGLSPAPFAVRIDAGIYTAGSITDGTRDITELTMALGKIVRKPWYKPFKLTDRISFLLGDQDREAPGIQPHPYYWVSLYLQFVVATGHGG